MKKIFLIIFLAISCQDVKREWDNPYDPRSNRALWTPDSLRASQKSEDELQITWFRKGRDFDGYIIDKKIGTDSWQDSVAILWDSLYTWIDTLDLKFVLEKPYEYTYRIYAYADTNTSNRKIVKIKPETPGPPGSVDLTAVSYSHIPTKAMDFSWIPTLEGDFKSYNLYKSSALDGLKSKLISLNNINDRSVSILNFSVIENAWYWMEIEDTVGLKTISNPYPVTADLPPPPVTLDSVKYAGNQFIFNWSNPEISDHFAHYIEQSDNGVDLFQEVGVPITSLDITGYSLNGIGEDKEHYYRLKTLDQWGLSSFSEVKKASSYQKFVTYAEITAENKDVRLITRSRSNNLDFQFYKELTNTKTYFPIWIQGGKKIFALLDGKMGLVIDADGDINSFNIIDIVTQKKPIDIVFNNDETRALFTTSDYNIYSVFLNLDRAPSVEAQNIENNRFFDAEFIGNGPRILCSKKENPNLNNIGPINIYTITEGNLPQNNIQLTNAPGNDEYRMPRMSPAQDQILYTKAGDGLYVLNYLPNKPPQAQGIPVLYENSKIIPEQTDYFRNVRWSPNGLYAILWNYNSATSQRTLYLYTKSLSSLRKFQERANFANWINDNEVIFNFDSHTYKKNILLTSDDAPTKLYEAEWARLQPRQ